MSLRLFISSILVGLMLLAASCADSPTGGADRKVYVSNSTDVEWSVERVEYGRGLSHQGDFNEGSGEEVELVGDLYLPATDDRLRPALVIVHGGGFLFGERDQDELVTLAESFAARGWVVLSIDYRLANDYGTTPAKWIEVIERDRDAQIEQFRGKAMYAATRDARAAVRYLQARAGEYRISPEHVAVLGGSAGAQIAVALGVTRPGDFRDELTVEQDPTLASTNLDESGEVAAVVDFWGGIDVVDARRSAIGGEPRWDASDAPILIVHGTDDSIVPFAQAERLRSEYSQTGAPSQFVELDGEGHAAWDAEVGGRSLPEVARTFLEAHLGVVER